MKGINCKLNSCVITVSKCFEVATTYNFLCLIRKNNRSLIHLDDDFVSIAAFVFVTDVTNQTVVVYVLAEKMPFHGSLCQELRQ